MRFTLTYDGELPSGGNGSKNKQKWEMRKHFHPQLKELWQSHPALERIRDGCVLDPTQPFMIIENYHRYGAKRTSGPVFLENMIDLCVPIEKFGATYKPFVRDSFALTCALNIKFLRKEQPGKVYQGGDLDNRIKTLLDALSMPQHKEQTFPDDVIESPLFCLMQDDSLLTGISVSTERLLSKPGASEREVRLHIEVDVRVSDARLYNTVFLGE